MAKYLDKYGQCYPQLWFFKLGNGGFRWQPSLYEAINDARKLIEEENTFAYFNQI